MIGLLGGTFDPVHYGHLRIALEVQEALELTEIRFIPCRQPPHRNEPVATPPQRLNLLRLALTDTPGFQVDTRELQRTGPSYMIDTLISLRAELTDTPMCLILGLDAFLGLPSWHCWQSLLDYAHIVVVQRPPLASGAATLATNDELTPIIQKHRCDPEQLHTALNGGIVFLETPLLDISASRIRALLCANRDPRYLLPETVLEFIRQTGLYLS